MTRTSAGSPGRSSSAISRRRGTDSTGSEMKPVRIGCSGWVYKDWRGDSYPEDLPQRRWLERYAQMFDTVEVNNTFYRLPTVAAVERWAEETPAGFVFAVKGSRYTTHVKRLINFPRYTERFFERIEPLVAAGKLG